MKHVMKAMMVGVLSLTAALADAAPLTPEAAYNRAVKTSGMRMPATNRMQLMYSQKTEAQQPAAYIFAYENNQPGFLIVSGDDQVTPVLGYSTTDAFDPQNIPDGLQFMLECYAAEINAAKGVKFAAQAREPRKDIAPLVKTQWDQDAPYFNDTPIVNGQHTVTGCVATSTAQVMNYHKWPEVGTGSNYVTCNNVTYTVNFAERPFDWNNMLRAYYPSATEAQKAAVANLMYCIGVGLNMEYGVDESGAYSEDIAPALINYFKYDKGCHLLFRNYFSQAEWESIMYEELAAGRPIIYGGNTITRAGHSFVCDGYQGDGYFHINWGWGGVSDGYFLLNALDPSVQGIGGSTSAFNYTQDAVIGIQKPRDDSDDFPYTISLYGTLGYSPLTPTLGDNVKVYAFGVTNGSYGFVNTSAIAIPPFRFGLEILSEDGESIYVATQSYYSLDPLYYYTDYTVKLPATLADGVYTLYPSWIDESGNWRRIQLQNTTLDFNLIIDGGNVEIKKVEETAASFPDLTVVYKESTPYYSNLYAKTTFQVTNNTDEDFYDAVYLSVHRRGSYDYVINSTPAILYIKKGETKDISFDWKVGVNAGNYDLYFALKGKVYEATYAMAEITVADKPVTELTIENFHFLGDVNCARQSNLPFVFDVTCEEGYFAGPLTLGILTWGGSRIAEFNTPVIYLNAGETQTLRMKASMLTADKDDCYTAAVFNGGSLLGRCPDYFTFGDPTGVDAVDADSEAEYFTLDGVKVEKPVKGMYIRKTNSKVEKIVIR